MHGFGTFFFEKNHKKYVKYVGSHKFGKFSGNGTLFFRDGRIYVGGFQNDERNGFGILTYPIDDEFDSLRYEGNFERDDFSGNGTFYWRNGEIYEGGFKNGLRHGHGLFRWPNGDYFEGQFMDHRMNGFGVFKYSSDDYKDKYEGHFKDDLFDGYGQLWWKNGEKYFGNFKEDQHDEFGTKLAADGTIEHYGFWKNGKAI